MRKKLPDPTASKNDAIAPAAIVAGSRVRYRFADKMTGTVVRRASHCKGGGWYVLWDSDQMLQAATENLELIA